MRALKILAWTLAGVAAVLVVGAVLLVSLFDPNDYKSYATTYVEERTGRTLAIDEELKLSFFPWLAIETGGITVGNAEGFTTQPFARIASLSARVKLLPLLRGAVEVGTVAIDGIELNLGRDEELRGNWEDLLTPADATSVAGAGAAEETAPRDLGIEAVRIRNGTVNWRENRTDLRFVLSGLDVATGAIETAEPVEAELKFTLLDVASQLSLTMDSRFVAEIGDSGYAARDVAFDFRVAGAADDERASGSAAFGFLSLGSDSGFEATGVSADARIVHAALWPDGQTFELAWETLRYDASAQSLAITGLTTSANTVGADWEIAGETLIDAPHLTGSVHLAADSAVDLLTLAAMSPPAGVDPQELGPVELMATFDAHPNELKASVANLDARALGVQITGEGDIDANILSATLAVPRFTPSEALYVLAASLLPESIDARELRALSLRASVETDLESGRTSFRNIDAELLGGTVTGGVTIAPSASGPSLSGTVKTSRFPPSAVAGLVENYLPENVDPDEIGVLAVDTRFNYDAATDTATFGPLALEAFGLSASGDATVAAATTRPRVAGDVRLAQFSPRDLLQRFGQPVPQTSDPAVLRQATVAARFNVDADNGSFESLSVKLDDSTITGTLAVANFASPSYRFDLSADQVDVDRYVPPPAEEAADGERTAGDIELKPEPLDAFRIEGQARVGDLKLANLRFQDVATRLAIGGGKATIDSAQAKLYGGEFMGGMYVDATGAEPTMTLRGRAAGLQLTPIIEALVGDANFSGTGSFDIDLTGRGPTVTDNLRSARGTMGFALSDGAIDGFNLGHVLCQAYNALQQVPAPPEQPKQTAYQLIQANATVENGVATSPELLARAAFVDVTGSGRLVLAEQTLDYDLRAKLTNPITIPRCDSMDRLIGGSIPFTIRGPVTAAEIRPDFGQIIQERVRDEVQDRLRERLEERLLDRLRD
ncbi:MAG TPA: AsmA family protein [Gammaproteobacteria bacterium]